MGSSDHLFDQLDQLRRLRRERLVDAERAQRLHQITEWQNRRLARTHADLLASPRYRPAVTFFLDDLYAPADFSQREEDLARISPVLARVLSDKALRTMGRALEMNVLTEQLDQALERSLVELGFPGPLSAESYAEAYRRCDDSGRRRRQIDLIRVVGEDLDGLVRKPLLKQAIAMARQPARMSGLGDLHELLERGFAAFYTMRGAAEFLDAIVGRELRIVERIYEGHPEPFELGSM